MKSASALLEQEPFADAAAPFRPVLGGELTPLNVRLSISTYAPRPGVRRPNEPAIALLDSWLGNPDPNDERAWAELKPELEDITMRLPEPEE